MHHYERLYLPQGRLAMWSGRFIHDWDIQIILATYWHFCQASSDFLFVYIKLNSRKWKSQLSFGLGKPRHCGMVDCERSTTCGSSELKVPVSWRRTVLESVMGQNQSSRSSSSSRVSSQSVSSIISHHTRHWTVYLVYCLTNSHFNSGLLAALGRRLALFAPLIHVWCLSQRSGSY